MTIERLVPANQVPARGLQCVGPELRGKVGGCVMQSTTRDRFSRTQPNVIGKILSQLASRGVDARRPPTGHTDIEAA